MVQYWATVCDAGPELKHWINVFLLSNLETKGWSRSGHRGTLFTLLEMNGESPDMSPVEPALAKRQYLLTLVTSKQILPFAFEEQHSAVSAHLINREEHDGCL